MGWLVALLKQIGSWLIPLIVQEVVKAYLAKQKEKREQKEGQANDQKAREELMQDLKREEGLSDEEYQKQKEAAFDKFTNRS